ncbi:MAG: molybdopterin oxidoreductase family protein [Myxococcales bacterium]
MPSQENQPSGSATRHYRTCTLCEAMCGLVIETKGSEVSAIRGDQEDPFSRGHICPKAMALKDLHDDSDRLRTPLKREGDKFVPIGWDEAFDLVAEGIKRVQRAHGKSAVALYQGNPTVHNYGSMLFAPMFMAALGTRARFSATSVDQLPHMLASLWMFGHQLLMPVPDLDRTDYFLVLGANPAVSNGSLMTAPGAKDRIEGIVARGGKVVVIDPRRSETSALASEHHFVRPGKDALLLLGLIHTVFDEQLAKPGRLEAFTQGRSEVERLVRPYAPERVAKVVGIEAGTIRRLAREFAKAERAVCYGRMGVSTQDFGGLTCWLINVLNIITGNLDRVGGAMFTSPAVDLVQLPVRQFQGHYGLYKSRVRGLPEFGGELPVAALAEEIETEGKGQIRGLVTSAGNPVLSTPNGVRLERALPKLEFMVSIDFYLNETTRHAHVILPPSGPLEHDHYDIALHLLQVRNTAKYSKAIFPRPSEARHDWEILSELTWRLVDGRLARLAARAQAEVTCKLEPKGMVDLLLRAGPHGDRFIPLKRGLSIKQLEQQPHGVDLGGLEPRFPERLKTRGKQIQLAPEPLVQDLRRLEQALREDERAEPGLVLIGRRQLRSNNSWMHNSLRLVKGPVRCTLQMHPEDAQARGLNHGELVQIRSRVGSVEAPLEVTEALMPGVVSLPHGWGHTRKGTKLQVAEQHPGASINDVTDEARVDALAGTASFSGLPVQVTRAAG